MNNKIEEINSKAAIEDYIRIFNLTDDPAGQENHFICPLCNSGTHRGANSTAGFNIYFQDGKYKWFCYACKSGGDIIELYKQVKGIATGEAIKALTEYFGIQKDSSQNRQEQYVYPPFTDKYGESLIYRKDRFYVNGEKKFVWHTFQNGTEIFITDNKGKNKIGQFNSKAEKEKNLPLLYIAGKPIKDKIVYVCEGEKDCENLAKLGKYAVSTAYGYGSKVNWDESFSEKLKLDNTELALVLVDNDDMGRKGAKTVANALFRDGIACKLIDIAKKWKEAPKKADISDVIEKLGYVEALKLLDELAQEEPFFKYSESKLADETKREKKQNKKVIGDNLIKYSKRDLEILQKLKELINSNPRKYDFSHMGLGYLLAEIYKDKMRFCAESGQWLIYNGKVWQADVKELKTQELLKKMFNILMGNLRIVEDETLRNEYMNNAYKLKDYFYRSNIIKDARTSYPIYANELDANINLLNLKNGTLDLETMEFKKHSADDLITKISNVDYKENAKSPLWQKFINDIMQGDIEKIKFLQRALGYALTGETIEDCMFIFYGATTRNGKSTLLETIAKVLGDYGETSKPDTIELKDKTGGKPSEDIARLQGKRFVQMAESEKSLILASALVKTLTGGDTINARFLHQNSFDFKPQFKIYFNTNYLPTINDPALFQSGRIKVIPFERHFSEAEQDKDLKHKLATKENLTAVLQWLIEGYRDWRKNGLNMPKVVENATQEYRKEQDIIFQFISECFEDAYREDDYVTTNKAYDAYKNFCIRNKYQPCDMVKFKQELLSHNLYVKQIRLNEERVRVILYYKLKKGENNPDFYLC